MERVAFLIEDTGERLGCLLNPASVVLTRHAGVRARQLPGGTLAGAGHTEDPLLHTGGGRTQLTLDLLFDVTLSGSTIQSTDVRDLTGPLWRLSENAMGDDGVSRLRLVRFVWGKAWNVPGVVAAVAERLEDFDPQGAPRRSWLRLRLVRVDDPTPGQATPAHALGARPLLAADGRTRVLEVAGGTWPATFDAQAGEAASEAQVTRPDAWAWLCWRDPLHWRVLLQHNGIDDPLHVPAGLLLEVPPEAPAGSTP
jgi:hypothetical protein